MPTRPPRLTRSPTLSSHSRQRIRDALIGGTGWSGIGIAAAVLAAWALFSLAAGLLAFRQALARERRLGTLGLY